MLFGLIVDKINVNFYMFYLFFVEYDFRIDTLTFAQLFLDTNLNFRWSTSMVVRVRRV